MKDAILDLNEDLSSDQQSKKKTPLQEFSEKCREKVKLLIFVFINSELP